ncbi:ribonuclease H-like domain-containing protein, partial [Tanacetum coccineum]
SNNDINVIRQSHLLNDLKEEEKALEVVLINSISQSSLNDTKRRRYKQAHEAARKDVERAFGVIKKKWAIIKTPARSQTLLLYVHWLVIASDDDDDNSNKKGDKSIGSSSELNLSFGDSLYLHPNDTGGSPIVTIKLTSTENYKMWSITMTFALRNHNKLDFIDGSCKKDNYKPALDTYDKVDGSAVFNLHKNINSLNQNGAPFADYYNNLNSLWKQFDALISLTLLKAAFAIVSREESYRNINSVGTTKPTATAFAAKTFDKKRFNMNNKGTSSNTNNNNRGPNPNLKYTNCNKIGHTVDRCFELVGYPVGYVKKNFNSNTRPVSSNNSTTDLNFDNVSSSTTSNSHASLSNE